MELVDKSIKHSRISKMATARFGNLVKAVVDIDKEIMVVDAEMHADEEAFLLEMGSEQESLWGINIYPDKENDDFVEFDSMINIRPSTGNLSRGIENNKIKEKIIMIVEKLVKR